MGMGPFGWRRVRDCSTELDVVEPKRLLSNQRTIAIGAAVYANYEVYQAAAQITEILRHSLQIHINTSPIRIRQTRAVGG